MKILKKVLIIVALLFTSVLSFWRPLKKVNASGGSQGETWVIKENPSMVLDYVLINFTVNFTSNNTAYVGFYADFYEDSYGEYDQLCYVKTISPYETEVYRDDWLDEVYRTVTFNTAPTGSLLTWLQANAVKVVEDIPVESIEIGFSGGNLLLGQTYQINPTVLPADATDKTVTYYSNNTAVATVSDSGLVTAVGVGTATITASAGGKSDTVVFTVIEDTYSNGYEDGYNTARAEYGIYINGEWVNASDYGDINYYYGYQDGANDTHDYYDDLGLFIPRLTPKGHLVIDFDLRYGEPYFYLQDFYNVDDVYFGYQHNRWLEKAFDWAYSVEEDFLAINDLYIIKYHEDEVIYKYFFYKYDTDSIYFYNDNGTLLKVVERVDFDYYVYEVPELSQEEQARIDNAYNKGMRDYGYYDSESEEYLTATEYGDIQYNLGVQSTRDNAYSDGFVVAMWYSHLYGYDWLHATYYDLIEERPILYNVHDITSFTYQEGHENGFNNGRNVGYDLGYDDGKIDGIDIGYDDGYNDGENDGYEDGYNKGYQVAVDNTYDTIYDDIYNIGYKDGEKSGMNNKFYSGLEKWIVPAIIVVLFFGLLMLFPRKRED